MIKSYISSFFEAIAAIASLTTLITICVHYKNSNSTLSISWWWLLLLFGIALVYSFFVNLKKKKITLNINKNLDVTIEKGNILEKQGIIAIPVNEYFDTHVGDGVISKRSIHGQFINTYFNNRIEYLDMLIESELSGKPYKEKQRQIKSKRKIALKRKQYDLGTCISFEENGNTFVLFALTHFDDDNKAYINIIEYEIVFKLLLNYLQKIAEDKKVFIPLFGTKFCRIHRTEKEILHFMISSIDFLYHDISFLGRLHIEIKELKNIDLTEFEV